MFKEYILYFFITKWNFCFMAPFHMVVNFRGFSPLNPLFLELKLKCLRMIKHHGWFVLSVGRRVALRPSHGHLLGKQVLMKGTWPTGVPAHTMSSSKLWDPFKSARSPHTSICAFLMSRGTGRMEALHRFHALVTQDSDHVPLHRVPGMFTDPGTDSSSHYPSPSSLSSGHCPLVRDSHQHLVLLIFVYFTPQSPRSRKRY